MEDKERNEGPNLYGVKSIIAGRFDQTRKELAHSLDVTRQAISHC